MESPTLVIMAAGMGSRFGGLKQIAPIDDNGHIIIDYSLFDAWKSGFRKVVFIITHKIEQDFKEMIGNRMSKFFDVRYVYQKLDSIPEGYSVPQGREKPWGTGHAVLQAADAVDGSFAVINADDFYGASAFKAIFDFLNEERSADEYAMVGYRLRNTVTENGYVARGICETENGFLTGVTERTHIEKRGEDAAYTEDGTNFVHLSGDVVVSMNLWGFSHKMFDELGQRFPSFLDESLPVNPLKCEYFLPTVANAQVKEGVSTVRVLNTDETWYGVTYREDLESVVAAVKRMKDEGVYPERLWGQA